MPEIVSESTLLPTTLPAMIPLENHRYKLNVNPRNLSFNLSDLLSFRDNHFSSKIAEEGGCIFDPYIQFSLADPHHEIILCGLKHEDIKYPNVVSVNKNNSCRYMAQIINNSLRTLAIPINFLERRSEIVFGNIRKQKIQINFMIPFVQLVRKP